VTLRLPVRGNPDGQCFRAPPELFKHLHAIFGFTIDAAASKENALLPCFRTERDDALTQDWSRHVVFCNPPFRDIGPWLAKARTAKRTRVLLPLN
jgi:phage N-6-adenine-methyltransferase